MTKEELITDIESKSQFIKWAIDPVKKETLGIIEKWNGVAFISTPEGHRNTYNVWFLVDTETSEAFYQQFDSLDKDNNTIQAKYDALETYCEDTFQAFKITDSNLDKNYAFVEAYTLSDGTFTKENVIVYKQGANPITHAPIA